MGFLSFLFGQNKSENIGLLLDEGAVILDVRTPAEFKQGHIKGAVNVPLQSLGAQIGKWKKEGKPVITCCRSGARSANAASVLKSNGIRCANGGAWTSLNQMVLSHKKQDK